MRTKTENINHLKITLLIVIIAMFMTTVSACKHTTVSNDQTSSHPIEPSITNDIDQDEATETDPDTEEAIKTDPPHIISTLIESKKQHANAFNQCFEEFNSNQFNAFSEELGPDLYPFTFDFPRTAYFYITIDKRGQIKELEFDTLHNEYHPLYQCLSKIIHKFSFKSGTGVKELMSIDYSGSNKILNLTFNDSTKECYEKYHMNQLNLTDKHVPFIWIIDKDGNAKNIRQLTFIGNHLNKASEPSKEHTKCIKEVIAHTRFEPTTTQKDVPFYKSITNPYDFEVLHFIDDHEEELNQCQTKAKVENHYYGFNFTINPDGKVKKVSSQEKTLNKNVANCYINILKKLQFEPTITGKTLYFNYDIEIGQEDE